MYCEERALEPLNELAVVGALFWIRGHYMELEFIYMAINGIT